MRPSRRIFAVIFLLAVSISGVAAQQQQAQPPSQASLQPSSRPPAEGPLASAARDLARKVAASLVADFKGKLLIDPAPANLSSASSFDFQQGCVAFSAELASDGMTILSANSQQTSATVHLTLSSNFQGFLWVADVIQGASHMTFFSSVVPFAAAAAPPAAPQLTLQRQFLLSLPDPILDAELLPPSSAGAPPSLLVLQPERVALFAQANGSWQMQSEAPIQHFRPWPRDLRGILVLSGDSAEALFPGIACDITFTTGVASNCRLGNPGWLLSLGFPGAFNLLPTMMFEGNTFTFAPLGQQVFDSLAVLAPPPTSGGPAPIIGTTPDSRALLFEGSATPATSFSGWGSDIAALWSPTRQHWPILVTRDGDWTQPDTIQAFDIVENQAVPVSAPIDFDGPITVLWSEGENEALAVSRNLQTGLYEAYLLRATYAQ